MARPKTAKQIQAELVQLRRLKPLIPRFTLFGDANQMAIDAEINVLSELLTEDDVIEAYLIEEYVDNIYSSAMEAARWLAGESELVRLSDEWKGLLPDHRTNKEGQ